MKRKYIQSLKWVIKLQWRASSLSFIWNGLFSVYSGLIPLFETFALAQFLAAVSAVALQGAESRQVYMWLVVLLITELLRHILESINALIGNNLQRKMELATNEHFYLKMYELSQEQFEDEKFNTKLDRARNGLYQLTRLIDEISSIISTAVGFIGAVVAIIVIEPWVGAVIIASAIPDVMLRAKQTKMYEAFYKKIEPIDRVAYRSSWMLADPNYMPEVRLMNAFKKLMTSWRSNTKKSHDLAYVNELKMTKFDMLTSAIQPLVSFGATVHFFRLLVGGSIGFDQFIFLRGILAQASNGASQTAGSFQSMHEMVISLHNFTEIYATEPVIPNGRVRIKEPLTIEFKDVDFKYPGSSEFALKGVSFMIFPGSKLALVGENGAGKTTLIKLLLRQYLPTSGSIIINGNDIRDIDQHSYYAAISNLSQDFLVVNHLTIKDNLLIGLDDTVNEKKIFDALDLVDASSFVKKLPHKLKTRLDSSFDDGSNLSGGQMQRLGVARALLRDGDIMILDEPTSAIDAKAEYTIFNNIYKTHGDRTTLIVSHRFSTVRKADKIIVMKQGKIIEYGSHEELLDYKGLYKEMFEAQAEGYR